MTNQRKSHILELLNDSPIITNPSHVNIRSKNDQLQPFSKLSKFSQIHLDKQHDKEHNNSLKNVCNNCSNESEMQESNNNPNYSSEKESISEQLSNIDSNKRKKFTPEEDLQLTKLIEKYGPKKWDKIALSMPGRTGRQCRDRYANYLNPSLTNGQWSKDEDILLAQKVLEIGQHWNIIAKFFKGRSANNIKNRWYTYLSGTKKCNQNISNKKYKQNNSQCKNKMFEETNCNYNQYNQINPPIYNIYNNYFENSIPIIDNSSSYINNSPINALNMVENAPNIKLISKTESEKKILLPHLYLPEDSFIYSLNDGIIGLLNPQFVL